MVVELEKVAARFDTAYTRMTQAQRKLIEARRNGLEESAERELVEEAAALSAAVEAALRGLTIGTPSAAELEEAAVSKRVLQPPVDAPLLVAVLRSRIRSQAFPLLSAAIRMSVADMPSSLRRRSLAELLAAPISMGDATARALCRHWALDPDTRLGDLDETELSALCDRVEDAAGRLPPDVRKARGQRPAAPTHGVGAGRAVLDKWVESTGHPLDGVRPIALEVSRKAGWPEDAVPVAMRLADFTFRALLPALVAEWRQIQATDDDRERLKAIKSQADAWWHHEDEDSQLKWWTLKTAEEVLDAVIRLESTQRDYTTKSGSNTAMALSRRIARGSGHLLSACEPDDAAALLASLSRVS